MGKELSVMARVLRVIVPFCAGYFLSYLLRTINAVISPELTRELGLSAGDLGLLTSTYFFSFAAAQIPVGIALDRFGARRVAAVLLLVAAAGAVMFAAAHSLVWLAVARSLIGLGVSACLMAGLKGFLDWFDLQHQPSLIGVIMACGALGALTTSTPVAWALPMIGWRGVFVAAAGLALSLAVLVHFAVPERARVAHGGTLADSFAGVAQIFRARAFWRFAPQSAMFTGAFMALQGLWVVPWLMNVNGYSRALAAEHLFFMGLGMLCGQLGIAALLARFKGTRVTPFNVMRVGLAVMAGCEVLSLLGVGPTVLVWALWSAAVAAGSQMYGVVAGHFSGTLAGRATTAINLLAFVGAFALQWGLGLAIDSLRGAGLPVEAAYRTSFVAMLGLQVAAYFWMLRGRGAQSSA